METPQKSGEYQLAYPHTKGICKNQRLCIVFNPINFSLSLFNNYRQVVFRNVCIGQQITKMTKIFMAARFGLNQDIFLIDLYYGKQILVLRCLPIYCRKIFVTDILSL